MGLLGRGVEIKTPEQIAGMRRAGLVVGRTLELLRSEVRPGVTTAELDAMLAELGTALDLVVELTVDEDEVVARLLRRAHTDGRTDDSEDVIRRRQQIYADETAPLTEVYRARGLLVCVDGLGELDDVTNRLVTAVDGAGAGGAA
jgi:adenylate kinase